jgi:hypothetical protein
VLDGRARWRAKLGPVSCRRSQSRRCQPLVDARSRLDVTRLSEQVLPLQAWRQLTCFLTQILHFIRQSLFEGPRLLESPAWLHGRYSSPWVDRRQSTASASGRRFHRISAAPKSRDSAEMLTWVITRQRHWIMLHGSRAYPLKDQPNGPTIW